MFYKYEIHQKNKEEVLYLYLSMKYEFANELAIENQNTLEKKTKEFIISNAIPFHGNKIYLIIDGIVVRVLDISNTKANLKENTKYSLTNFQVSVELEDHSLTKVSLYEFLMSILLNQYEETKPKEIYKVLGILFSTYAYKYMKEDGYIKKENLSIPYYPLSYYQKNLKNETKKRAILHPLLQEIDGMFLSYKNNYILPFLHYSNDGETLRNKKYPYLSSVKSLWDLASPYYIEIKDISYQEIYEKYGILINQKTNISFLKEEKLYINKKIYTTEEIKNLFHLKSNHFYLILYTNYLRIITKGYGNSYGLSIFGATEMAKDGIKYYDILKYYFPKCKLSKHIKELS